MAHLALLDQIVERAHGFFDRRVRVRFVRLIQINVIGVETLQAFFDRQHDDAPRRAALDAAGVDLALVAEFGGEHDVVAARAQHLSEADFRTGGDTVVVAIHVRRIEQRDAGVERGVHDAA